MPPLSPQDKDAVLSLSSLGFSDQEALDAVSTTTTHHGFSDQEALDAVSY